MTTPKARPRGVDAAHADVRRRIVNAAIQEFALHGFEGASVRAICRRAGVNVAAVNYYFQSKEKLYWEVFHQLFEDYGRPLAALVASVRTAADWAQALRSWLRTVLEWWVDDRPPLVWATRLILRERWASSRAGPYLVERVFMPFRAQLEQLVRMGLPPRAAETDVFLWVNLALGQMLQYGIQDPPWDTIVRPRGWDRRRWARRVADHMADVLLAHLRFRGGKLR